MVLTEEQLIEGIKRGNSKCQSLFYSQHAPILFGIALRYTESDTEAKEVLQEAFIKVFENIEQYCGTGIVRAWMSRVVVNQALKLYHRKRRHEFLELDDEKNQTELIDESVVDSDMLTHEILLQFIDELSDGYRMVFNLCEIEGYSHDEIAKILSCSAATSRSQLFKAKNILRKKINDFLEKEERI